MIPFLSFEVVYSAGADWQAIKPQYSVNSHIVKKVAAIRELEENSFISFIISYSAKTGGATEDRADR